MKNYEVLEDNAGQLYLAVFDDKYNCIYIHGGYEYNPGQLQEDLQALKNGDDVLQWDGNCGGYVNEYGDDPNALYNEILAVCEVVADNDGVYPEKMGIAAQIEFQEQLEIMKEDAHLVDSGLLDKELTKARQEWYGIVRWHPEDVIAAAASNSVEMTFEQAVAWWEKNEQAFVDRMTEAGNEILSYMDFE